MKYAAVLLGALIATGLAAGHAKADDPVDLRFATVGVGSAWYVYGAGIAELMMAELPEGSNIDVLPIAGGVGNMHLLQNGEAELAISFGNTTGEACRGVEPFEEPLDKVRGLVGGLDIYYLGAFVTESSGITSWDDVVSGATPANIITAGVGGTGEFGVRQLLGAYGTDYDGIAATRGSVRALDRAATAAAISDGAGDMWAHVVTRGHPIATQLTAITDMRMLPISDEAVATMMELGWAPASIPANTFEGQTEEIQTVAARSNIAVSADMDEEVAYLLTKAVVENADKLPAIHAGMTDFDPAQAADRLLNGNCELHPGAVRYYQEAGLL